MIWSTNYGRLLCQTLFTFFFAGRDFAPKCVIDGENIQDWLQEHFINAIGKMADKIRDAGDLLDECVIGWDSMNEPFEGLCGWQDLNVSPVAQGSTLKKGTHPTPAQSLRLGMGQAQTVENWTFSTLGPSRHGSVTIDPKGYTIWADPSTETLDGVHPKWGWKRDKEWVLGTCIWAQHGVWDIETGYVLRPDYFRYLPTSHPNSKDDVTPEVEFIADYWKPHFLSFAERIRSSHPNAILFVQPPVFAPPPPIGNDVLKGRAALSAHYYDGLTLVTRHWNWFNADALGLLRGKYSSPIFAAKIGESAIRKSLQEQLGMLKDDTAIIGPYPLILGEIGVPLDMDDKRSYGWTDGGKYAGDYSRQEKALDASLNGADGPNAINYTVWTYCPDSTHRWGDGWNMEDLSLWSEDDSKTLKGATSSTLFAGDDTSRVLLLKKISESTASLSTVGARTVGLELEVDRNEAVMTGWRKNPYEFLTDGARAVRAFCRPWPTKVIGKPTDIEFQISKAYFKLVVQVRAEDKPVLRGIDSGEELATEIYVPLVHYAHSSLVRTQEKGGDEEEEQNPPSQFASANVSAVNLVTMPPSILSDSSKTATTSSSSDTELVDIDVTVSTGRWSVQGQTLKWWYDVPSDEEPDREYTIEIRRQGGVIRQFESKEKGWCDEDGACPIM